MHRIYMTKNLINGKKYVGRCSKDERWDSGYLGSGVFLKQAIRKYGRENFERIVLTELSDTSSLREAIDLEKEWLLKLDCKNSPDYYNMSNDTGGMGAGDKHSSETKEKISESMKEFYGETGLPAEWRENVTNALRGRVPWNKGLTSKDLKSDFYSKRRAPTRLTEDDYVKIKELYESGLSAAKIGKMWNVCHKVILGMIRRGGPSGTALSSVRKGIKMSVEQKQKISESVKNFHKNKKENDAARGT